LRFILMLLAWGMLALLLKAVAANDKPAAVRGVTVLDLAGGLMAVAGCVGCYPLWPFVLMLLAVPALIA
jgi:hypothetical protein